jgi:hypothetical protein
MTAARAAPGREPLKSLNDGHWLAGCAAVALGAAAVAQASDTGLRSSPSVRPIITAIGRGDCTQAIKVGNEGVNSGDARVIFVIGRMVNEGICTPQDRKAAVNFFAHAVQLGDTGSALDFATKVGLGDGAEQSYERAGELCRAGGLDPAGRMSRYSLGYACTVGGLAAELLRTTLPSGAFRSGTLRVEFTPSTGAMEIRSTPSVALGEGSTGSNVHHPLVDAPREITRAWKNAVAQVPKPDTTILDKLSIEMPLDVDMTLESPGLRNGSNQGALQSSALTLAPPTPFSSMKTGH